MNTLNEIFTYFAKFPQKAGVLELFNRSASDLFPGYTALKTQIARLDPHSLIPGIKGFVFGIDEQSIKKRIEEISGTLPCSSITKTSTHRKIISSAGPTRS
jgi:hypothetical protein